MYNGRIRYQGGISEGVIRIIGSSSIFGLDHVYVGNEGSIASLSVDSGQFPTHLQDSCCRETHEPCGIRQACEDDQAPKVAIVPSQNFSCDWYACETSTHIPHQQ